MEPGVWQSLHPMMFDRYSPRWSGVIVAGAVVDGASAFWDVHEFAATASAITAASAILRGRADVIDSSPRD
jgi:hypothetical protein